ncbi:MAG: cytochrome c [Gammaproteobacteria bacterium]|jgi:mono/diheme cytochrome c family protein|nr:cytochrome c [Gammaproteobacteria bacterium]
MKTPIRLQQIAWTLAAFAFSAVAAAADAPPGKPLFTTRCGMCHQTNGMGVSILSRRPADASKGLLEARDDLSAEFVYVVARMGTGNMPRISRAEVSDEELREIALYISRGKP